MKTSSYHCPNTKNQLYWADSLALKTINEIIKRRKIRCDGRVLNKPLEAALLEPQWQRIYPVIDGIAMLLETSVIEINDRKVFHEFQSVPTT